MIIGTTEKYTQTNITFAAKSGEKVAMIGRATVTLTLEEGPMTSHSELGRC
jgi:hypothetical protein